jgi:hypothetical protein
VGSGGGPAPTSHQRLFSAQRVLIIFGGPVRYHLPQRMRPTLERRMRDVYHADSALDAEEHMTALGRDLYKTHPSAAASLSEGLAETLTRAAPGRAAHPNGPYPALDQRDGVDDAICREQPNAGAMGSWRCVGARSARSKPVGSSAASTASCACQRCRAALERHFAEQNVGADRHDETMNAA